MFLIEQCILPEDVFGHETDWLSFRLCMNVSFEVCDSGDCEDYCFGM